jgi:predicted ATPase
MELLYLRIFDTNTNYPLSFTNRDINFKPEHKFYYDDKTGEITYSKNENYNESLYGNNTRVTGLIGGNGVGKSTLLKFLQYLITKLEGLESNNFYLFNNWEWQAIINKEGLQIAYGKTYDELDYEHGYDGKGTDFILEPISFENCIIVSNNSLSSSLMYSPHLDLEEPSNDTPDFIDVSSDFIIYHESREKEDNNISQIVDFRQNEIKRQIAFMQFADLEQNEHIQFYNDFKRDRISVSFKQFVKKFNSDLRYIDFDDVTIYKEMDDKFLSYSSDLNYKLRRKKSGTDGELARLWFYKRLFEVIYYNAEYRGEKEIDTNNYRLKLTNDFKFKDHDVSEILRDFFTEQIVINATRLVYLLDKIDFILNSELDYEENDKSFICSLDVAKTLILLENELLSLLPYDSKLPLFTFDWQGMSTGEKAYLNLFSRIHYGLNILDNHQKIKDSKQIYFLIDEPSTGFHPQWQKEYLDKLLSFLEIRFEGKKHLIISSHSPFLVSDLQKEDVVALSTNNQSHAFTDNTFGANIHELLADSFFLNDGFIGDFAKNKIAITLNWLKIKANEINKTKKNNKTEFNIDTEIEILKFDSKEEELNYHRQIIDLIGEPLVKNKLKTMFIEFVDKDTEYLKYELEKAKAKVLELEKRINP